MIKGLFICFAAFVFFTACNKKDTSGTTVVEYQVSATNSSNIDIIYNNVLGDKITVSAKDGWSFDVTVPTKPFTAYVKATSSTPFSSVTSTCTVTILVNGSVVQTTTNSSNTLATAEAQYTVQ